MFILLLLLTAIAFFILYVTIRSSKHSKRSNEKHNHAIILGGSIAGMSTAAYLTKYFHRITILETDDVLNEIHLNSSPEQLLDYRCSLNNSNSLGRKGVTQNYQIHVLQGEGAKILFELFPRLKKKLINEYHAMICSLNKHFRFVIGDVLLNKNLTEELSWFCIDRFTLEMVLRREFLHQYPNGNIQWLCNTKVMDLIVDQKNNSIEGVQYRSEEQNMEKILGDFVIDCTGRYSSARKWLKNHLNLIIPTEELHTGTGYVSFIGQRFRTGYEHLDSLYTGGNAAHAPHFNKGFLTIPIRTLHKPEENSLGFLSNFAVYCVNDEYPPNDSYENLLEWVKEHLHNDYYLILKSTKLLSPLLPYRRAFDHRRNVQLLGRKWPKNFILLGDSMCVFNPKNGQGMTHACRQARQLDKIFSRNPPLDTIPYLYNNQSSSISEECWLGSITNDWAVPTLKLIEIDSNGMKRTYQRTSDSTLNLPQPRIPLFMRFLQWYTHWLIQCAHQSGELTTAFLHVVFQEQTPYSLLKAKYFSQILSASFRHYFSLSKKIF